MKNKKALTQKAYQLGTQAFKNNLKSIPVHVHDTDLMSLIASERPNIGTQIGSSIFLFKAWTKGWHTANLSQ
jgi:hypothetical protein